jgi:hypothetical protein
MTMTRARLVETEEGTMELRHTGQTVGVTVVLAERHAAGRTVWRADHARAIRALVERPDGRLAIADGWTVQLDPIGLDVR